MDFIVAGAEILDDLGRPGALDAMRRPFDPFAVAPHVVAMAVMDPDHGGGDLSRRVDDRKLRRHQDLVARQHHLAARLAEFVDHVDHDHG